MINFEFAWTSNNSFTTSREYAVVNTISGRISSNTDRKRLLNIDFNLKNLNPLRNKEYFLITKKGVLRSSTITSGCKGKMIG